MVLHGSPPLFYTSQQLGVCVCVRERADQSEGRAVVGIEPGCLKLINRPVRVRDSRARQQGPSPWHVMLIGFVLCVCAGGADIKIK